MRVNWREEEIRLLLTYYKRMKSGDMHKTHPLVLEASKAIRELEINKEYSSQSEKFRNPNGVALKLANFLFLDPKYEGKGMKGCSVLDRRVFNEEKGMSSLKSIKKFPYRFESWLSSNDGGVRKPMDQESGRPLGNEILESNIHRLIKSMVKDYVRTSKKTICALVGGPGNGKTDLMEYATDCFFEEIGYDKIKGKKRIKKEFDNNNRKARFSIKNYNLLLTQDASQRDDNSDNYLDALAQDFEDLDNHESPLVLICINRGILENLKNSAKNPNQAVFSHSKVINKIYELNNIDAIIQNKTVWGNNDIADLNLYTWSMDYDSLFSNSYDSYDLIQTIVDKSECLKKYDKGNHHLHPANCSFEFLNRQSNNSNLSKLMRYIEILNGKRFTYREVFSLIAYLFGISEREEQTIKINLNEYQKFNNEEPIKQFEVLFSLYQYSPSYKFFNSFLFANDKLKNSCIRAFKNDDAKNVNTLFKVLRSEGKIKFASIPYFIGSGEVSYFDPIYFEQNNFEISDNSGNKIKLKTITDKVSYNSELKIDDYSNIFSPIDIEIIKCVEKIKNKFCLEKDYDDLNSQQLNSLDVFKGYLNSILISFIKRGALFSNFFIRDKSLIEDFVGLTNPANSRDFLLDFKKSISTNSYIQNSLSTSVGQTSDQVKHNVYSESEIEKLTTMELRSNDLPSTDQIFFRYKSDDNWKFIVITYKIYKNIKLHSESIFPSCLDKNYHLWNDLKKIELSDKESRSQDLVIEGIGAAKYNRQTKTYSLVQNS